MFRASDHLFIHGVAPEFGGCGGGSPVQFFDDRLEIADAISHSGRNCGRANKHVAAAKLGDHVVGLYTSAFCDRGDKNVGERINRALNARSPFVG
ncbi:hypothetical protein LJ361_18730 [Brucella sp. JSBI001]|nr:hypothetical protein [Brucella sp. JSBI001]UZD69128.1 hypothetical protein LJ361_18730 [Brucella sp. JSBI001]